MTQKKINKNKNGLMVIVLILSLAGTSGAGVIDVVIDQDFQGEGFVDGWLDANANGDIDKNDIIAIKLVLNHNPYSGYPSYDGYVLSSMDVGLTVSGPGTLSAYEGQLQRHQGFVLWDQADPLIAGNAVEYMAGISFTGLGGGENSPADLVRNLLVTCLGAGNVQVDLALHGASQYAEYGQPGGGPFGQWLDMVDQDLGDLTIVQGFTLSAEVTGGNGSLAVSPFSDSYESGTVVNLTATADTGYRVLQWSGSDNDSSTDNQNTVTMTENKTVTVEFEQIPPDTIDLSIFTAIPGLPLGTGNDICFFRGTFNPTLKGSPLEDSNDLFITIGQNDELLIDTDTDTKFTRIGNGNFYRYIGTTDAGVQLILLLNIDAGYVLVIARNIDLAGLKKNDSVDVIFGRFFGRGLIHTDQNIKFLRGVTNTIRSDIGRVFSNGFLIARGKIAAQDPHQTIDAAMAIVGYYGGEVLTEIFPAVGESFIKLGSMNIYIRNRTINPAGKVNLALIDLDNCIFILQAQGASIPATAANFTLTFGSFSATAWGAIAP